MKNINPNENERIDRGSRTRGRPRLRGRSNRGVRKVRTRGGRQALTNITNIQEEESQDPAPPVSFSVRPQSSDESVFHNLPLICLKFALVKNQKVCVSKWRDKRDVLYMSTIHSDQMSQNEKESTAVSKKHILIETIEMNNDIRKERKRCSSC